MANRYDHKSRVPSSTQQFTQLELKRIKDSMEKEVSKINYPKRREHHPYGKIFCRCFLFGFI